MTTPKIIDNDRDEITAKLDGKEIRGWSYKDREEYRFKMRLAREFVEGWYQCQKAAPARDELCEELADALKPFAEFARGRLFNALPDDMPMTKGSAMARLQVKAEDFKKALSALTKAGRTPK